MVPNYSEPLKIVRTIHGQSTGGDDDIYIASDGSQWKRVPSNHSESTATLPGIKRQLKNGWLLP